MVLGLQMTQERLTNVLREYTKYRRNNCMMYSYSGIRNAYYLAYLYKFYGIRNAHTSRIYTNFTYF